MSTNKATSQKSPPPNQTLYVNRLNTKLRKPDLRRELYMIFSTYGSVLDVVALKTTKMRGQAHVTFKNIESATQAMRALNGTEFFGSEMSIHYAKSKSNIIAKLDGTFKLPQPKGRSPSPSVAGTGAGGMSALQASVFNAPPSTAEDGKPTDSAAPKLKPLQSDSGARNEQGTKRPREEEDEESDVPMEEDDGSAMEESDED